MNRRLLVSFRLPDGGSPKRATDIVIAERKFPRFSSLSEAIDSGGYRSA